MYYILHTDDGELVGVNNDSSWPQLEGVSVIQVDGIVPNLNQLKWNKTKLAFESNDTPLSKLEFMSRFTTEERIDIRTSTDPVVSDYIHLLELAQEIDLKNQTTIEGLNHLASVGILTEARVSEILG